VLQSLQAVCFVAGDSSSGRTGARAPSRSVRFLHLLPTYCEPIIDSCVLSTFFKYPAGSGGKLRSLK